MTEVFSVPHKGYVGFGPAAHWILGDDAGKKSELLVCSDARGEGMFISEVAMAEKRPGHIVDRASKKLAGANWNGGGYKLMFTAKPSDKTGKDYENADELFALLRQSAVNYIVLDDSMKEISHPRHFEILRQSLAKHPDTFKVVEMFPLERGGIVYPDAISVYRRITLN